MPAYNAEAFIGQAIESVLAQSTPHWELVIVNDGSSDHTAEVISRYDDPRIRVIWQENRGESAARNSALRNIYGEFLAFLDADDLYLPHHLELTVEHLLTHPQTDGVYTDGHYIDQAGKHLQTLSSRRRGPYEGNLFEEIVYGSNVFGPPVCVVLRAETIFERRLMFDENIVIGPDWDFFMQFADRTKFGYINQHTCLYRLHTSNISTRVGLEKRVLEISKCRMKAVKMTGFRNCSLRTRVAVFYDLLINVLLGYPEQQSEISEWLEFIELPKAEQSRLFRLMATKALVYDKESTYVELWLRKSCTLNARDWRGRILMMLFNYNPKLLVAILRYRLRRQSDPRTLQPFADIRAETGAR